MNLPVDPNDLPPPTAEEVAARQPQRSKHHPSLKTVGIAAAVLLGIGVLGAISNSDDDRSDTTSSAGTGDAAVDEQIVDTVWDSMKGELCPAFDAAKAAMPKLSEGEVYDMGVSLTDMGEMTPAQLARLRELALADC